MFGLLSDLAKVALAPVKVAEAIVRPVTQPVAETVDTAAEELRKLIQEALK